MRLFFALLPGPDLAREIADWRERSISADGRPVPLANLHITLAFLGELSHHRLDPLCQAADELLTAPGLHLQTLRLNETGYWPRPGILWLGPSHWEGALANLAGQLQSRGALAGGKVKRGAYRPHLTLFRGCDQPPPPRFQPRTSALTAATSPCCSQAMAVKACTTRMWQTGD